VDCSTGTPLPDYWTALTFATVMGTRVLTPTPTNTQNSSVKIYSHCAKQKGGAVVALVINLSGNPTNISATSLGNIADAYVLSPSDDAAASLTNATGLLGTGILLNGDALGLSPDGSVPEIKSRAINAPAAQLAPRSIGFFVFADAKAPACQ